MQFRAKKIALISNNKDTETLPCKPDNNLVQVQGICQLTDLYTNIKQDFRANKTKENLEKCKRSWKLYSQKLFKFYGNIYQDLTLHRQECECCTNECSAGDDSEDEHVDADELKQLQDDENYKESKKYLIDNLFHYCDLQVHYLNKYENKFLDVTSDSKCKF